MNAIRKVLVSAVLAGLMAACATPTTQSPTPDTAPPPRISYPTAPPPVAPPPPPPVTPPPPPPPVVAAEPSATLKAFEGGVAAYERGDFRSAIRLLTPVVTDKALTPSQRREAFKTKAFSECLTNRLEDCRRTFEQAFRADPTFELSAAERSHPVWGPQYQRARKAVPKK